MMRFRGISGFTLYELLLTLLLIAVIVSLATPQFSRLLARQQQRIEINALLAATYLSRKESIVKRRVVTVCPSRDLETCGDTDDWSSGWLLFINADRDSPAHIDPGEAILHRHRVAESITISANRRSFTQRATFLRATNGTLVVCHSHPRITPKALVISFTGRPRIADQTTRGNRYSCGS